MPLYLKEDDVARLLDMRDCIEAVEEAFRQHGARAADFRPRARARIEGGMLHVLPAASAPWGRMAAKVYATTRRGAHFIALLFDGRSSELLAVIEADRLGQIRTGAATAVATRHLAAPGEATLGVLGTGWQARGQAQAIACVRPLREIRAWGRDAARLKAFCADMEKSCGAPARPAASAEEAVRGAGIVVTATSAEQPVLRGEWLEPGAHLNAVGSNRPERRELDGEAVRRADLIVIDSIEQGRLEAGDLLLGDPASLDRAVELSAIIAGRESGRRSKEQITLFKSLGIGLEDLAAASVVYDRALESNSGRPLP